MRRGPKSTPTALMLMQGGKAAAKRDPDEPDPLPIEPAMPKFLHAYAQEEWREIVPQLRLMGVIGLADKAVVAAYCQAFGQWRLALEKLALMVQDGDATAGMLIKTSNGNVIQNPMLSVANKAREAMVRAAAELGLTPAARAQISTGGGVGDDEISRRYGI